MLSLFFFLTLKQKHYLLAAIFAAVASGTRIVGVFLVFSLAIDLLKNKKFPKNFLLVISYLLIAASGFIAYSYYLYNRFGDPLMYLHVQSLFGANRSSDHLISLPQVIYRYLKMVITVDRASFVYQRIWLELISFALATYLLIKNWKNRSLSLNSYLSLSLLLPTLTGTLSSVPRYILVLVPFLFNSQQIGSKKNLYYLISSVLMLYLFYQYTYGVFVA